MEPPKQRRFRITITVDADEWHLAARELERVTDHVVDHGPVCNSVSGGWSHYPEASGE